jgi:hypothetical protein
MRFAIACGAMLFLVACSTHNTTARLRNGDISIYQMSEVEALEIAHRALVESFPSRKITNLEGPTWGFSTTYRMALDTYSQQVLVLPMEGFAPDGSRIRGMTFDVSGSGSAFISGSSKNRELFRRVQQLADATGTQSFVVNSVPVSFRAEDSRPSTIESTDVEDRLRNLRSLLDQELITPEQFEAKQNEILDDL